MVLSSSGSFNFVRERLGLDVVTMPGGHLMALSRPQELADLLIEFADF